VSGSKDGLQIEQDLKFQRREWRVQRIVWVFLAALLVVAIAGLVGPGPLSSATTGTPRLRVHYLRFARWQAPESLVITAAPDGSGTLQLALNRSFLDSMAVQQITPDPAGVKATGAAFLYTFDTATPSAPTDITFDLQPTSMGTVHGIITAGAPGDKATSVELTQLVYP
jgi:hypothetical protein